MAVIFGTNGADTFNGTALDDILYGHAEGSQPSDDTGNDVIDGLEGDDTIAGGGGIDRLTGGQGADILDGQGGNDILGGGDGADTLHDSIVILPAINGNDTMNGDAGDDMIESLAGIDTIDGGVGNDVLDFDRRFASAALTLNMAALEIPATVMGNGSSIVNVETIYFSGGSGADTVTLLAGNDALNGGGGNDILNGGAGNDTIFGGLGPKDGGGDGGSDTMNGGAGDDLINSQGGADTIDGGTGNDILYFDRRYDAPAYTLNMAALGTVAVVVGDGSSIVNVETIYYTGGDGGDTVTLLAGNDTIWGGGGNDNFNGGAGNDRISGGNGDDALNGGEGDDSISEPPYDNLSTGNDSMNGGAGNDKIDSRSGIDAIDGGAGNDTLIFRRYATGALTLNMVDFGVAAVLEGDGSSFVNVETFIYYGGSGVDTIALLSGNDTILGAGGKDNLNGGAGNDTISGGAISGGGDFESDSLAGGAGDDTIYSTGGADTIDGGTGNDTLVFARTWPPVGHHTLQMTALGTPATVVGDGSTIVNVENIHYYGGLGVDTVTLLAGDDIIYGGGTDDVLDGGAGNDTLYGDDLYYSSIGYSDDDTFYGNAGNDTIESHFGVDIIDGGTGNDILQFYRQSETGPSLTLILAPAGVASTVVGDGSTIVNVETVHYYGGGGIDTVSLLSGNDTIWGKDGADHLSGGSGNDDLAGGTGNDNLNGGSGSDILDGGTGDDSMSGGAGNDTYTVDHASDATVEASNAGADTVKSSVTHALRVNVENLVLTGTSSINGSGNALANDIAGNSGSNILNGLAGADTLRGLGGNDTYDVDNAGDAVIEQLNAGADTVNSSVTHALRVNVENLVLTGTSSINGSGNALANDITGNSGSNILNGLAGADAMTGLAGNDTYYVDNLADTIVETLNAGGDYVRSTVNWTLGANLENLYLLGTAVNGTGNTLNNLLYGTAGANMLDGGVGADKFVGGNGSDVYIVDSTGDLVYETSAAGGTADEVRSSVNRTLSIFVENLLLTGNLNTVGIGNTTANVIVGNTGNNFIDGKLGSDALTGGLGFDQFLFTTALGATNIDTIADFSVPNDTIRLENAVFTGLAVGTLSAAAFRIGTAAADATDRIVYNSATGAVLFDADGNGAGAAKQFAALSAGLALTAGDFFVF